MKCPEHEKLKALGNQNQILGNFLEWLQERDFSICEFHPGGYWKGEKYDKDGQKTDYVAEGYYPVRNTITTWLAQYFDIDLKILEKEKEAMIDEMRKQNAS